MAPTWQTMLLVRGEALDTQEGGAQAGLGGEVLVGPVEQLLLTEASQQRLHVVLVRAAARHHLIVLCGSGGVQ